MKKKTQVFSNSSSGRATQARQASATPQTQRGDSLSHFNDDFDLFSVRSTPRHHYVAPPPEPTEREVKLRRRVARYTKSFIFKFLRKFLAVIFFPFYLLLIRLPHWLLCRIIPRSAKALKNAACHSTYYVRERFQAASCRLRGSYFFRKITALFFRIKICATVLNNVISTASARIKNCKKSTLLLLKNSRAYIISKKKALIARTCETCNFIEKYLFAAARKTKQFIIRLFSPIDLFSEFLARCVRWITAKGSMLLAPWRERKAHFDRWRLARIEKLQCRWQQLQMAFQGGFDSAATLGKRRWLQLHSSSASLAHKLAAYWPTMPRLVKMPKFSLRLPINPFAKKIGLFYSYLRQTMSWAPAAWRAALSAVPTGFFVVWAPCRSWLAVQIQSKAAHSCGAIKRFFIDSYTCLCAKVPARLLSKSFFNPSIPKPILNNLSLIAEKSCNLYSEISFDVALCILWLRCLAKDVEQTLADYADEQIEWLRVTDL